MPHFQQLATIIFCSILALIRALVNDLRSHEKTTSFTTILKSNCETELDYLFSKNNALKNANVLVGCRIRSADAVWAATSPTSAQLLEMVSNETFSVLKCEGLSYFNKNMTSVYIPYNFQANAQARPNTFTRACLQPTLNGGHLTMLYATISLEPKALGKESGQLIIYFERQIKEGLPEYPLEAKYKQFPEINIRLPADFFYPFSCSAAGNSISQAKLSTYAFLFTFFIYIILKSAIKNDL